MLKYINFLSRLIMASSILIIGFEVSKEIIAISALIVGVILQIIYKKMKKIETLYMDK